ncbi:MAG: Na+/H+ antiporter NhaC family protein [Anaerovorax sp.]
MKKEKVLQQGKDKGNGWALLPIAVFLVLFIGSGIITGDFYAMPALIGFVIALCVAFAQNKKMNFNQKVTCVAKGIGNDNIITMCMIFILAGAFSGIVKASGGAESTVNFGLAIMPTNLTVVGLFVIGCFISISMGTSMGTIAALAPIAVGISEQTGFGMPLCIGAVVCGAMFGDNLSMISDTTIAAVRTQGCEMKDKFKQNFFIVLPAAIITILIFFFITRGVDVELNKALSYNVWQIMPYLIVLVGALIGFNVFLVLIAGIAASAVVGVATGMFGIFDIFTSMGEGATGMYDITVISITVAGITALIKENGGIQCILHLIKTRIGSKRGAEFGIFALGSLVDVSTANNTVAIVMAGPIAKEISDEFGVSPKRSASLLDISTSVFQGLIPYGAQLLSAASLTLLTPFDIIPYLYYPILMGVSALIFVAFRKQ